METNLYKSSFLCLGKVVVMTKVIFSLFHGEKLDIKKNT